MKIKSIFHQFWRAIIEAKKHFFFGRWEPDFNEFEIKNKGLIVNFEQISCSALVFLLLTLNMFYLLPISTSK